MAAKVGPEQWGLFKGAAEMFSKLVAQHLSVPPDDVRLKITVWNQKSRTHLATLADREGFQWTVGRTKASANITKASTKVGNIELEIYFHD